MFKMSIIKLMFVWKKAQNVFEQDYRSYNLSSHIIYVENTNMSTIP